MWPHATRSCLFSCRPRAVSVLAAYPDEPREVHPSMVSLCPVKKFDFL